MGLPRDTFYRHKAAVEEGGIDSLIGNIPRTAINLMLISGMTLIDTECGRTDSQHYRRRIRWLIGTLRHITLDVRQAARVLYLLGTLLYCVRIENSHSQLARGTNGKTATPKN